MKELSHELRRCARMFCIPRSGENQIVGTCEFEASIRPCLRMMLEMQLASAQVRPHNITEFSSIEAIKQCVAAGMGIGLLPEIVIASELKKRQFAMLNWQGAKMSIETSLVWHKDRWLSPAMQAFLDVVTATATDGNTDTNAGTC